MIIHQVLLHGVHQLSSDAARTELGLELPGRATVARTLAAPTERVRRDLGKAPPDGVASIVLALLHNIVAVSTADLGRVILSLRIAPQDVPSVDTRVIDTQSRPVKDVRQNPHVLDGAPLQHPAEVDFAGSLVND